MTIIMPYIVPTGRRSRRVEVGVLNPEYDYADSGPRTNGRCTTNDSSVWTNRRTDTVEVWHVCFLSNHPQISLNMELRN